MKKAIIMKGLPGSGKSTLAEKYREDGYKVFSRDQARLDNPTMKEPEIESLEKGFILEGFEKIVIDNTHMWHKTLDRLILFCKGNGYTVEVVDMLQQINREQRTNTDGSMYFNYVNTLAKIDPYISEHEYLEVCLKRNSQREGHKRVPDSVIYQMYLQNYELTGPKEGYVIVDIDGTIADLSHRLHYLESSPKNYDAFYDEVDKDLPIEKVIDIVRHLSEKHFIVITSGRTNKTCDKTVAWLKKYNVPYDALLMKQGHFIQTDIEAKKSIYEKCLANKNIIMSIDDRPSIVELWRSFGIFTIDVNQRGDF